MRHCLVLLFSISFFFNAKAQNCGFQGPRPIYFDSIFTYDINVFDYINDDLSGSQKIDSITLRFISPELSKLSISLISPKGDTVFLVGPINDYVENDILGGIYRLTFIPTSMSTDTFRWQNDYPGIPPNGVYFPFKNDLQGFTGKVNGTWKLLVNTKGTENEISGDLNSIRDVKIHFAIIDGDNCCKANAGEIKDTIINACAGNTELVTLPGPAYASATDIPDTTLYGYGYMIYRNDTVFDVSANRDLRNLPPGNYKAKGFSFIKDSISIFQSFIGKKTSSEVLAILQNPLTKKDTCGALSNGEYVFNLKPANCVKKLTWILPKGDSILFDGKFLKQEGVYKQVIPKIGACDSITELNIKFIDFICPKETFQVGDSTFRKEGAFLVKLSAISGCDSLVNVKLKYYSRDLKIILPEELTCVRNSVSIDVRGTKSAIYKTTFEWRKLDASIGTPMVVGTNPLLTVSEAGFYQLNIMYDEDRICTDTLLQVIENKAIPQITKATILPYTCKVDSVIMGGTLTSEGVEFSYFWSTSDGKLGVKKNEKFAYALSPGNYKFKVSNIINGCRDSTDINIHADTLRPLVLGGGDKFLTCATNTVTIGSALSDGGSGFIARWTIVQSNNLSFFSQPTRKTQTLSSPGIFKYNVENTRNGCKDSVTVMVAIDTLLQSSVYLFLIP